MKIEIDLPDEIYNRMIEVVAQNSHYQSPEHLAVETIIEMFKQEEINANFNDDEIPS